MILMLERRQRRSAYLGCDINGRHEQVGSDTGSRLGRPLPVIVVLQVGGHHDFGPRFRRQRAVPHAHRHLFDGRGAGVCASVGYLFGFPGGVLFLHPGGHRDGVRPHHRFVVVRFLVSGDGDGRGRLPPRGRSELAPDRVQDARHSIRLVVRQPDDGEHGSWHQTAAAHQRRRLLQLMSTVPVVVQVMGVGLQLACGRLQLQQSEHRWTTVTTTTIATYSGRTSDDGVSPPQGSLACVTVVVVRLFFDTFGRQRWCRRPRDNAATLVINMIIFCIILLLSKNDDSTVRSAHLLRGYWLTIVRRARPRRVSLARGVRTSALDGIRYDCNLHCVSIMRKAVSVVSGQAE